MLSYRQAFPQAFANSDRPNPFPNHYLVAPDEVRTLLRKHGFTPLLNPSPPRAATREEIADPNIRTYQLIKHTDAAPRDLVGLGCVFTLGRTYCFGESIPEIAEKETTPASLVGTKPWAKPILDVTPPAHLCACGEKIDLRRYQLNYRECMACGEEKARKVTRPSAPISKSNYVLITNREQLKQLNPKRLGE